MPATFGLTNDTGLTTPAGGTIEECSIESEVEAKTIKDQTGTTCRAMPSPMIKTNYMAKGRGTAALSLVTAGAMTAGAVQAISVKNTESNDDFPTYEITGVSYATAGS
jgi:hypothetical protein